MLIHACAVQLLSTLALMGDAAAWSISAANCFSWSDLLSGCRSGHRGTKANETALLQLKRGQHRGKACGEGEKAFTDEERAQFVFLAYLLPRRGAMPFYTLRFTCFMYKHILCYGKPDRPQFTTVTSEPCGTTPLDLGCRRLCERSGAQCVARDPPSADPCFQTTKALEPLVAVAGRLHLLKGLHCANCCPQLGCLQQRPVCERGAYRKLEKVHWNSLGASTRFVSIGLGQKNIQGDSSIPA